MNHDLLFLKARRELERGQSKERGSAVADGFCKARCCDEMAPTRLIHATLSPFVLRQGWQKYEQAP